MPVRWNTSAAPGARLPTRRSCSVPTGPGSPSRSASRHCPGHEDRLVVLAVDLSERKRFERALRQSEERFQLASRATNDVIGISIR